MTWIHQKAKVGTGRLPKASDRRDIPSPRGETQPANVSDVGAPHGPPKLDAFNILAALHCPILRVAIGLGAVAPVERLAVQL